MCRNRSFRQPKRINPIQVAMFQMFLWPRRMEKDVKTWIDWLVKQVNYVHVRDAKRQNKRGYGKWDFCEHQQSLKVLLAWMIMWTKYSATSHKLVEAFSLSGFSETAEPLIMGIEGSGTVITGNLVRSKLLQDTDGDKSSDICCLIRTKASKNTHQTRKRKLLWLQSAWSYLSGLSKEENEQEDL